MNDAKDRCKNLLIQEGIDINSEVVFDVNGTVHTLSFLYIIETFMEASSASQTIFFTALEKSLDTKEMGVERFFEGMGQLLLVTHLSQKI